MTRSRSVLMTYRSGPIVRAERLAKGTYACNSCEPAQRCRHALQADPPAFRLQ
jgi:hypothetical protein